MNKRLSYFALCLWAEEWGARSILALTMDHEPVKGLKPYQDIVLDVPGLKPPGKRSARWIWLRKGNSVPSLKKDASSK